MRTFRGGVEDRAQPAGDWYLAERAAAADAAAFGELYRRHSPTAWGIAQAVAGDTTDAAEAVSVAFTDVVMDSAGGPGGALLFRPRLVAATRKAAIEALHRNGGRRADVAGEGLPGSVPMDLAFRSLPERWRTIVWLDEAERLPTGELAGVMGLTPARTEELAARAGAGLRERYLQANLAGPVRPECGFCVEHLGAYVAGRLRPRHLARTDRHLAGCEDCCDRLGEVADIGGSLRRIALPLPLFVASDASARWRTLVAAAAPTTSVGAGSPSLLFQRAQKPLLVLSTGIFALGVISATVVSRPSGPERDRLAAPIALRPSSPQIIEDVPAFTAAPADGMTSSTDLLVNLIETADLGSPVISGPATADAGAVASTAPTAGTATPAAANNDPVSDLVEPVTGLVEPVVAGVLEPVVEVVAPVVSDVTELLANLLSDPPLGLSDASSGQPAATAAQPAEPAAAEPTQPSPAARLIPGLLDLRGLPRQ